MDGANRRDALWNSRFGLHSYIPEIQSTASSHIIPVPMTQRIYAAFDSCGALHSSQRPQ